MANIGMSCFFQRKNGREKRKGKGMQKYSVTPLMPIYFSWK
jgi:hypothetical protein